MTTLDLIRHDDDPDRDTLTRGLLTEARERSDPEASRVLRERAIVLNLDVAARVSRRFRGRGVDDDDLEQVAYLGLCKAAERFREPSSNGFTAYAVPTISGEIKRYFRDRGWLVRPPRRLQEDVLACRAATERLVTSLGREPTRAELALHLGFPPTRVADAQTASHHYGAVPYDARPGCEELRPAEREPESRTAYEDVDQRLLLAGVLARLDPRDRVVLDLRFGDGATQREIALVVGVSQMQVSRILARALATMRQQLEAEAG